jgi:threonine/homoserine/homoserine lactone efflux protein
MFTVSTAGLFVAGVAVILAMPGPTNTLLAAAGLRQGFRASAPLTLAELAGYLISITVWGRFLDEAAQVLPWLPGVVRASSSLYIGWLAWRMWRAASAVPSAARQLIGMRTLFVATLLNPKGILFASAIFPGLAFQSVEAYLAAMGVFAVLLVPIGLAWVLFGASLAAERMKWIVPARLQRGVSIVLGVFSATLAWSVFR